LQYMAERFDGIDVENTLGCLEPKLMRRLLQSERLACDGDERSSEVVARYLRLVDRGATTTTTATLPRDDDAVVVGDRPASSAAAGAIGRPSPPTSTPTSSTLSDEDFYWLTHCQIMPRISPKEALFYYARGARYPRVMAEVGSGSLRSRCLAAATADVAVMNRLSSRLEVRAGGGGGGAVVGSGDRPPPDSADCCAYYYYETLDPSMKVELLESMMVGARRIMVEGERKYARREGMDREVRMSDEIMYKKSNIGGGKMASTTSVSNEDGDGNGGGGGGGGGGDDDVSKAVVLGCGAGPANGIYISVPAAGRRRSAWDDDDNDDDDVPSAGRRHRRLRRRRGGETNDAAVYERVAVWNGKRVAFVLYPVTSGQFYVQYKLGVRHRGGGGGGGGGDDDDHDEGDGDRRKAAAAATTMTTRVLYNSPKIVVGDAAVGLGVVIIPDQAWEMEDDDAPEGLRPPPQFVGRLERPVMIASRLNNSLMDSPPERGGWVT